MGFLKKIFGDYSSREIKRITPIKDKVLALEEEYSKLTDEELKAKTPYFKERLANGETLDDILPEAFAACREASWRVLGMKHFPVQVLGGIVLHQGRIAEMKTGEGKTLVLGGMAVLTTGRVVAPQEGIVDMSGPGVDYTPFSRTCNVVLSFDTAEDLEPHQREACYRIAGLNAAHYLASACKHAAADSVEA